jgi:hypothetical protein
MWLDLILILVALIPLFLTKPAPMDTVAPAAE